MSRFPEAVVDDGRCGRLERFNGSTTESLNLYGNAWLLPLFDFTTGDVSSD